MRQDFGDFIRNGGNGEFVFHHRNVVSGRNSRLSLKTSFPGYSGLREAFETQLKEIARENTRMLLLALTPPDTVPTITESDLLDLTGVRAEIMRHWDAWLADIYSEYQTHPQRLRPLRISVETQLLRSFAGLINQIRQEDLGNEQYIWRSRDDDRVRTAHAGYDDQLFRWNNPPEGGHPGQAHNCRCYAEPVPVSHPENLTLVDFALPADGFSTPTRGTARKLLARTPAGLAILTALQASNTLQNFTRLADKKRIQDAAATLGADTSSVEGLIASIAYAKAKEIASAGLLPGTPKSGERAEIVAQALGLYAMHRPEFFATADGQSLAEIQTIAGVTLQALDEGRLVLQEDGLAQGWIEVSPELDPTGTDLLDLPGFTVEGIEDIGGVSAPHILENTSDSTPRKLPENIPETAPDRNPVNPAPDTRGLPGHGEPETWVVGPRGDRLYGSDGKPIKDVDWAHDHGQGRPHVHDWKDRKRLSGRPASESERFSGNGRRADGQIRPEDWRK